MQYFPRRRKWEILITWQLTWYDMTLEVTWYLQVLPQSTKVKLVSIHKVLATLQHQFQHHNATNHVAYPPLTITQGLQSSPNNAVLTFNAKVKKKKSWWNKNKFERNSLLSQWPKKQTTTVLTGKDDLLHADKHLYWYSESMRRYLSGGYWTILFEAREKGKVSHIS